MAAASICYNNVRATSPEDQSVCVDPGFSMLAIILERASDTLETAFLLVSYLCANVMYHKRAVHVERLLLVLALPLFRHATKKNWTALLDSLQDKPENPTVKLLVAVSPHVVVHMKFVRDPLLKPFVMARLKRLVRGIGRTVLALKRHNEEFYDPEHGNFMRLAQDRNREYMQA
jgi:hypothetical protein